MKNILQCEAQFVFSVVFTLLLVVSQPLNLVFLLLHAEVLTTLATVVRRQKFMQVILVHCHEKSSKLKKGFERLQHFKCCSLRVSLQAARLHSLLFQDVLRFTRKPKFGRQHPHSQRLTTTWMTETFTQVETLALRLHEVIGCKWTSAVVLLHYATWLLKQR